jgi:hypothetical protein
MHCSYCQFMPSLGKLKTQHDIWDCAFGSNNKMHQEILVIACTFFLAQTGVSEIIHPATLICLNNSELHVVSL